MKWLKNIWKEIVLGRYCIRCNEKFYARKTKENQIDLCPLCDDEVTKGVFISNSTRASESYKNAYKRFTGEE